MTIFLFALKRSLQKKSLLVALCLIPFAMIFIRPLWVPQNPSGFSFLGMLILFSSFSLVRIIMTDRVTGVAVRIFAAPVTNFRYMTQNLFAFSSVLSAQIVVLISIGAIIHSWDTGMALSLIFCYIVFAVTSISFSLAWYGLFRSKVISDAAFGIVISFMSLFGGIFVPISLLPDVFRKIGMLFPTYWFSNALLAIQGQNSRIDYYISIIMMIMFSLVFLLYGSKRRLE